MEDHWLVRPTTIRLLWIAFASSWWPSCWPIFAIEPHPYFGLDGTFGFGAWFGFASCVVLIVFAKALGAVLKRPDTYYDR